MTAPAVRLTGVTKRFGPVIANDAVDLEVMPGTIHGIIGENGAGKSTLVSILYGFYTADEGTIEIGGKPAPIQNSADAIANGTHKLREIMEVTDSVSVMRRGQMVGHRRTADTTREELAELMVGRAVSLEVDRIAAEPGAVTLAAKGLTWRDEDGVARLSDVSLDLRAGEILGLAGVSGNGQSELLDILSGIAPIQDGQMIIGERVVTRADPLDPAEMRRLGISHVPEDRHRRALVLPFEARENAVLGYHDGARAGAGRMLSPAAMQDHCETLMTRFDVRPIAPRQPAAGFSGGNQQKLVMAREIETEPQIMLIGQPTRGVDIGGIAFIHAEIMARKAAGCAILLVSVELDEIMALSDRIAVMNAGRIVGQMPRAEADTGRIGLMMAGVAQGNAGAAA